MATVSLFDGITRQKYHVRRFRSVYFYGSIFLGLMIWMICAFYPGEDATANYASTISDTGLSAIYGTFDTESPAWLYWVTLQANTYLYIIPVIVGILVGSRVIPTRDDDGMELLLSTSTGTLRKFYLENLLSTIIVITLLLIPSYVVLAIYSVYNNAADILDQLLQLFFVIILISFFYIALTSTVAIWRYSSSAGKKMGFGYLIYSFLLEMSTSSSDQAAESAKISVNYYLAPSEVFMTATIEWDKVLTVLFVISLMVLYSWWKIESHDVMDRTGSGEASRRSLFPQIDMQSPYAQKKPFLMEQLKRDRTLLIGYTLILSFLSLYIIGIYSTLNPVDFEELMTSFESPLFSAMTNNHDVSYDFTGFLIIEIFAFFYLYFGLFVLFVAASVATNEVRHEYQDLVWGNNFKPNQLIIPRIKILMLGTTILVWSHFVVILGFVQIFGFGGDFDNYRIFQLYVINWLHYLGLGLFLVAITMITSPSKGRKNAILVYVSFIFVQFFAYMSEYEWLRYLSYFGWVDSTGIVLGIVTFWESLLKVGFVLGLSTISFVVALKYRYWNTDLI
ncbi:MAG: hypothetical protein ACW99Q_00475 [Candidatus Kariarchaeaceae archaeon]